MKIFGIEASTLKDSIGETFRRYTTTIVYCVALALFECLMVHDVAFGNYHFQCALFVYLVAGVSLSFFIDLIRQVLDRKKVRLAAIVGQIAILLNAVYVFVLNHGSVSTAQVFDVAAVATLCLVAPFVLPFLKKKDDMILWHFSREFCINSALVSLVMLVLLVGCCSLIYGFELLFTVSRSSLYINVLVWLGCLLFPAMILMRMPLLAEIRTDKVSDKFSVVVFRLLIVLLCVYLVMLYAYILQITFAWKLPKGKVAWPVSCMMIILLAVRCVGYGINCDEQKIGSKIVRILPLLALPPLVLMSIGIGRRLMDYGFTAPRFYLVLLNLWFYAACVYMILRKRILPIIVSFIVLAFVFSFGPTSAWRLFSKEMSHPTYPEIETESPKYGYTEHVGYGSFKDGQEILFPEPVKKLKAFRKDDLEMELSPIDSSDIYLIEVVEGYPFQISREQLFDHASVMQCTNGKTIMLRRWRIEHSVDSVAKDIKLLSVEGFVVE